MQTLNARDSTCCPAPRGESAAACQVPSCVYSTHENLYNINLLSDGCSSLIGVRISRDERVKEVECSTRTVNDSCPASRYPCTVHRDITDLLYWYVSGRAERSKRRQAKGRRGRDQGFWRRCRHCCRGCFQGEQSPRERSSIPHFFADDEYLYLVFTQKSYIMCAVVHLPIKYLHNTVVGSRQHFFSAAAWRTYFLLEIYITVLCPINIALVVEKTSFFSSLFTSCIRL